MSVDASGGGSGDVEVAGPGGGDGETAPLLGQHRGAGGGHRGGNRAFRWNLNRSLSLHAIAGEDGPHANTANRPARTLSTFSGVFVPVALSMFSTVMFLRIGFVVGQAGLLQTFVQLGLAYFILFMTILSICAISTNGAIEGGGAYYMISRALGPEFGGSIGLLFFLANIFSCALYITGFVEGMMDNFGPDGLVTHNHDGIPGGSRWWSYLYCSIVLSFCLIVCLIGGAMFARTSVFILLILVICIVSVILSMFIQGPMDVEFPKSNPDQPHTNITNATTLFLHYTGLNATTLHDNLPANYTIDYMTQNQMGFAAVFAVLFSSVTGIMNGANMSGELKDPSKAIPRGTLAAAGFTLCTYIVVCLLTAATCDRGLLINNYNYLQPVNLWPPFIIIGTFAATLSAALGNLIGGSRILQALANDSIFWNVLKPATITTKGGNPIIAVLISWLLVQLVLLIGSLNTIAPMASELFLLSYAATNLACLGLELASAPNFRPTFRVFTSHTCMLGLLGCLVMCFFINAIYASVALLACFILIIVLHFRTFPNSWGSISQAIIFHQVRKYLLLLDTRKDHVKFWRPQMLLMVSNPRSCVPLIDFINDIKKSGLYVLGHVCLGTFDATQEDPCQHQQPPWQELVDQLKVKAFVELTLDSSVRNGMHHLIRVSGLGGMKPNTICFGFYDDTPAEDTIPKPATTRRRGLVRFYNNGSGQEEFEPRFPVLRTDDTQKDMTLAEYTQMLSDVLSMQKNVCLFRHFHRLNKEAIFSKSAPMNIDVWPINFFSPQTANYVDSTCLFLLQIACILHMVPGWKTHTQLRIFLCVDGMEDLERTQRKRHKLSDLLRQLRIPGKIELVDWEHVTDTHCRSSEWFDTDSEEVGCEPLQSLPPLPAEYFIDINKMIQRQCSNTAVVLTYLPHPPLQHNLYSGYHSNLEKLTSDLPPTVMVHGVRPVTSTTL